MHQPIHQDPGAAPGEVVLRGVTKRHGGRGAVVVALDDVSVRFAAGSFTAILGPSGSGKSTLLQCAAGLDLPDRGEVAIDGVVLGDLGEDRGARLRRGRVGFVFQSFNLLPALTAAENVALPLRLARQRVPGRAVTGALEAVGSLDRGPPSRGAVERPAAAGGHRARPAAPSERPVRR